MFFTPLKFNLGLKRVKNNDSILFSVNLYFLKIAKVEVNYLDFLFRKDSNELRYNIILKYIFPILLNKKRKKQVSYKRMREMLSDIFELYIKYLKAINYITKRTYINKIDIFIQLGLYDAALTAIFAGFLYTVINTILALTSSYIKFTDVPAVSIKPDFNELRFDLFANSIIVIRLGHIIIGGFLILLGGLKNERASNRRFNENNNGKFERYG